MLYSVKLCRRNGKRFPDRDPSWQVVYVGELRVAYTGYGGSMVKSATLIDEAHHNILTMWHPEIVQANSGGFRLQGFEAAADAAFCQEWIVHPVPYSTPRTPRK